MIHICNNVTCSCGTKYCSNCCNGCPGCGKGKAIISVASTTNAEPTIIYMDKPNYEHSSHTHCFQNENNPCGLNGRHCCLCDIFSHAVEPVEQKWEKEKYFIKQVRQDTLSSVIEKIESNFPNLDPGKKTVLSMFSNQEDCTKLLKWHSQSVMNLVTREIIKSIKEMI